MNVLKRYSGALLCSAGLVLLGLLAACGGGDQGRDPILGLPAAALVSVAVTPAIAAIPTGGTLQLTATANYADGSSHDVTTGSAWTSASPAVATINGSSGLATGVAAGTSVLAASFGGKSGSATLTVNPAVLVAIALAPAAPAIALGANQQFIVTGRYSDGSSRDVSALAAYASATPAVATIGTTGLARGVSAGTAVMTASIGTLSASSTLTVTAATLTALSIAPANPTLLIGASQQLTVTATYSDGSTVDVSHASAYSSATPASVGVGAASGLSVAAASGSAIVSASFGGLSASTTVTVPAATLSALTVTPANATIAIGATQQFIATGSYTDGSSANLSASVAWTSSSTAVGTIVPGGLSTAVAAGSATITASSGGKSASATLTVNPVVVVGPGSGTTIDLGGATNFGVLAGTAITNNSGGSTLVTGNVGSPSQTVDPVLAAGYTDYKSGAILTTALADLQVAISKANQMTCTVNSAAGIDLGGRTFGPGVYCYAGAISVTGTFTMNGPGLYVFRTASTLNTTANSIVAFTGGATAGGVYWVPVAATTLGANSVFQGSILGQTGAITMGDSATLQNGRVLSGTAVTLKNNPISIP
ncbi:ice-binding family protein [Rugamonas sp.]|uniref:ice-binding family protein n=1 Tax=Rugamonas sp. TaxID=1926287 RepID=UPI0025FA87D0|nr:ice-binding family protein [Rugamonas sp.]